MPAIVDQFGKDIRSQASPPNARNARKVIASRLAAHLKGSFDSADTNTNNRKHWLNSDNLSADAAMNPSVRKTLRSRARYEVGNNCYARGIVNTLANDCIGTGVHLQMLTDSEPFNQSIEREFNLWSKEIHLPQKSTVARKAMIESGEVFLILTNNPKLKGPIKLDIALIEADQVVSPFSVGLQLDPNIIDGITFDEFRNPTSYNIPSQHPGSLSTVVSIEKNLVAAENVIHLFRADRPGQSRGIPEITPALPLFALLRRYTLAVVESAETAANLSWILKTSNAALEPGDLYQAGKDEVFDVFELERGMGMMLPMGWDTQQMDPKQPTTTYPEFKDQLLNEIARCLNMPFNIAAGNSKDYNYASGRLDHQTYFMSIRTDQAYFSEFMFDRILERWLAEAMRISQLLPIPIGIARREMFHVKHDWLYDGHEHVDPIREAKAQDIRLKNLTTSLTSEYAAQGKQVEMELEKIARERRLLEKLGLAPGTSEGDDADDIDDIDDIDDDGDDEESRQSNAEEKTNAA